MVSRRGSPDRMGTAPESRQPEDERFHTMPWPCTDPALHVTAQCTGKRYLG